jgi:hypothetical protein
VNDVVALDISLGRRPFAARWRPLDLHWTVFDLAGSPPEPFDSFAMLGNNLGLLGAPDRAPQFLDALANMAHPGARIVGETLNPYATRNPDHLPYQRGEIDVSAASRANCACASGTSNWSRHGGTTCSARPRISTRFSPRPPGR